MKKNIFLIVIMVILIIGISFGLITYKNKNLEGKKMDNINNISNDKTFNFNTHSVKLNSGYDMPILGLGTWTQNNEETENKKYPVIVLCNGSGTPMSKYSSVAAHLASCGFIVIGTEENYSWNAFGAEISIRYLERFNENETIENTKSVFYQKVDFNNVGVVGHSQGGSRSYKCSYRYYT